MPTPFSAERFYALTGRRPQEKVSSESSDKMDNPVRHVVLPEITVDESSKIYEDRILEEYEEDIYDTYDALCEAESYYNSLQEAPSVEDVDRIEAALNFVHTSSMFSMMRLSLSNDKMKYQCQIVEDITQKHPNELIPQQDAQYIYMASKNMSQLVTNSKKHSNEFFSSANKLDSILKNEAKKQGITVKELENLSPEGREELNDFLKQSCQQAQKRRHDMENAPIKSSEYFEELESSRRYHNLKAVENTPQAINLMDLMKNATYNR